MPVTVEKVAYAGWPNCYRVTNGKIEFIMTSDVGPRVIRFGFVGGPNEFAEFPEDLGRTGGETWRIYGGHRLWHSPESRARTYFPDNGPVSVDTLPDGLEVSQPMETKTGIVKCMRLTMDPEAPRVTAQHQLKNGGVWPVEMAAWCLSVMAPGGVGLAPQPREGDEEGLLPNRTLILWPYTEMCDPRYVWGSGLVRLSQDSGRGPTKFGLSVTDGWAAYVNRGHLFLKEFAWDEDLPYPDGGASVEIYTNERMLELETLSPLVLLEPGEALTHTEVWSLFDGFALPEGDDEAIARIKARMA
ncbi:MAG: hypothetical protein ACM3ZC_07755 [Bacteroidota bacterium]